MYICGTNRTHCQLHIMRVINTCALTPQTATWRSLGFYGRLLGSTLFNPLLKQSTRILGAIISNSIPWDLSNTIKNETRILISTHFCIAYAGGLWPWSSPWFSQFVWQADELSGEQLMALQCSFVKPLLIAYSKYWKAKRISLRLWEMKTAFGSTVHLQNI